MKRCIRFIASVLAASTIALAMPLVPFTGKTVSAANGDLTASIVGNEFFFEYMVQKFNTDGDTSSLSAAECAAVKEFRLPGYGGPTDGSFLRYFPNVTELDLSGNDFKTIDVSTMTNLTSIDVSGNELTGLDLSKNTKLQYVRANSNQYMSSLKLPNSSSLTEVYVYFNSLSSVDLSGCPNLDILEIYQNNLTSLNVSACKNITWIRCFRNNLTSLDISQNSKLSVLECYGNSISTLSVYGVPALVPAIGNFTRITENGYTYDEWSRGGSLCLNVPAGCNVVNTPGGSTPTSNPTPTTAPTPTNISGATITVADQIYTGYPSRPSFTVTLGGKTLVADTDFTYTYSNNSGIGTGKVTITGKGNYTGTAFANFKIKGDFATRFIEVDAIPTQTWTGSAIQPAVTVRFDEKVLTKDTDYTVSYSNNTNVGTGTVTITGKGNYSGTKTATFTIAKASTPTPTPISGATIAAISDQTYTGNELKPSVTVTLGGKTLTKGTDYTVAYTNNTNVGTATVTITGSGNFTGTKTANFKIKGNFSKATVDAISDQTYTGSAIEPAINVTFNGSSLTKGTDYTVAYSNNTAVGTATVKVTGIGLYSGEISKTFKIKGDIKNATISGISNQTWTGSAIKPAFTVTFGGKILTEGTDYTAEYINNTNVGTATITVTGKGDYYTGYIQTTFKIEKNAPTPTELTSSNTTISSISSPTYNGSAQQPSFTVTVNGKQLTKNTDYKVEYKNNINAGTATITITGNGNYKGTVTKTFTINAASISGATVNGLSTQTYTGSAFTPVVTVVLGGKTLVLNTDYTVTYSNNTNAGSATVKITGKGNYKDSINKSFTISAKSINGASVAAIANQTYTGKAITPSVTVTLDGKTLVANTDYTATYTNNTNVGTATVTIIGKGNYNNSVKTTFKIVSAATPTPTPAPKTGVEGFCERLYTKALGRASDPNGVKSWVDAIKGGADGARAAYGFFFSPEFTSNNYSNTEYVTRLYRTFMDREPDTSGLNAWVDALNKGATREQVFYGFVNSIEWANICLQYGIESGGTASPTIRVQPNEKIIAFTTRLYTTCLGRNADPSGLKAWAEALANREGTGAQVAYGFFFSEEFVNRNYSNDEYVNRLYLTFLDRPADSVGKKSWVDALNGGASREMVFYGFANSTEFMAMCGDAGIRIK